jgi:tetratricopeptide (TPR) repeat protein
VTARADADPEIGEDPEFLRIRGRTLINLNRREDALEVYQEWIRLSPKAVEAYWYKALACRSPEHYQAGLDACERALALDPKSFRLLVEKSWLLRQTKRYDEALRVQDQLLVLSADSGMEFDRGEILRALGRHDEAVLAYDRFSGAYGDDPVVLTKKGLALIELGRFEEARDAFDRALAIRSDYEPAVVARDKLLDAD